ncbi:unnamed protein product [Schistosoma mattheei]|uniref:Uncharacterized protein n=1 Tax=Schistosoma mattheei TaxID=31246 RepID=A0A3P8KXK0_9TREM|nr:unnamed protein product [Schistosoma mattheei]
MDCNSKPKYHLWLIGRGGSGDYSNSNDSSLSVNRGYLGQVHIFEPTKFTQPINSFDLDNGFLPTAAVYVKYNEDSSLHHKLILTKKTLKAKRNRITVLS